MLQSGIERIEGREGGEGGERIERGIEVEKGYRKVERVAFLRGDNSIA